jgi:cell division protein FtsA
MESKIVVGLDIGTTKIAAIVGRKNEHGKLEVLGMGKAPSDGGVIRGMVANIDKTVRAINKALKEAEEKSGVSIDEVNVGIAGHHIKSFTQPGSVILESRDSEITQRDVSRLTNEMYRTLTAPGNEIIHVMPQNYQVDNETDIKDPVGMVGVRLQANFHMITAHKTAIANINKCVQRSGLDVNEGQMKIDGLILEPMASSLSVLSDEEKEAGVVLVDIGGGTTDVAIFHDGIIRHTAVIPFGGNIITQDIKEGLGVMQNQAEQLKTKFGKAIDAEAKSNEIVAIPGLRGKAPKEISMRNLAGIIQARMEDIIELVHDEVIRSGYKGKLSTGMVLTGGGAQLKFAPQLFEYMTGMDVYLGIPNEHLGKSSTDYDVKSPMYSTAIGLVLAGFTAIDSRDDEPQLEVPVAGNRVGKILEKSKGNKFFENLILKTKGLLIDDNINGVDY